MRKIRNFKTAPIIAIICISGFLLTSCIQDPKDPDTEDEILYSTAYDIERTEGCEYALPKWKDLVENHTYSLKLDNAEQHYSNCLAETGQPTEAVQVLRNMSKESPLFKESQLIIAEIMLADYTYYNFDSVQTAIAPFISDSDEYLRGEALWISGQNCYKEVTTGDTTNYAMYDSAIEYYTEILNLESNHYRKEKAQYRIGWTYYQATEYEAAILAMQNYLELYPSGSNIESALFWEAKAYSKINEFCKARELFLEYQSVYPYSDRQVDLNKELADNVCL